MGLELGCWRRFRSVLVVAEVITFAAAASFTVLFHTMAMDVVASERGMWALDQTHHEPGTEQLLVGIVLHEGCCLRIAGRGVVWVEVENKRTKDRKWVKDCGVKVREGNTLSGWRDTVVEDSPIEIRWDDDGQMRERYRRQRPDLKVVPTRMIVYLPAGEVLGQRHNWTITNVRLVPQMWEVIRCD